MTPLGDAMLADNATLLRLLKEFRANQERERAIELGEVASYLADATQRARCALAPRSALEILWNEALRLGDDTAADSIAEIAAEIRGQR